MTRADGLPLDFRHRTVRVSLEEPAATVPAQTTCVGPHYFETMGIPLLGGRVITADDRAGSEPVTVLSEPLARRLFPAGDALGGRVAFALGDNTSLVHTVVGVTADVVTSQMSTARPQMFVPLAQHPASGLIALVVAGLAGLPPARRAARVEPVIAMRAE